MIHETLQEYNIWYNILNICLCYTVVFHLAIWNEHQTKIDMVHKLLRSAQDKLEEQIKMRKEQVSMGTLLLLNIDGFKHVSTVYSIFKCEES